METVQNNVPNDLLYSARPITIFAESFLFNRTQVVKINYSLSNSINITSGVPRGTVLRPTLFLIFINNMAYFPNLNLL